MTGQLELDIPWPYRFTPPLETRALDPGLSLDEVAALAPKEQPWAYEPRTGTLTIFAPLTNETEEP